MGGGVTPETNGDRPHKFAGRTEESRQRQQANLSPLSAVKHAAYSPGRLRPIRERVLGELQASFPSVRLDRLALAAQKRARIELLSDYIDEVGLLAHRLRGTTYPAVALLQREEASYSAELTRIEELAREVATPDPVAAVRAYIEGKAEATDDRRSQLPEPNTNEEVDDGQE
jgi:hypothetical protein